MKLPVPEFSRPLAVDRVPKGGSIEHIAADAEECAALARRLSLPAIHDLSAELTAEPWRGGGFKLEGRLSADLEQVSVVGLEAFRRKVAFPVLRYFLPAVSAEGDDIDVIEQGSVDMGEVVAETLALELDPYPRKEGEEFAAVTEAAEPVEKSSPFAVLSGFTRK
ncbi:MAG: YceD family protein [Hyphomicrobiales bacterium]